MTYQEVKNYIEHMDANGLLNLCNDIYEWKYVTGKLSPGCTLNMLAENLQFWELRDIEEIVLCVAVKRFRKIVPLLMLSAPQEFIRRI